MNSSAVPPAELVDLGNVPVVEPGRDARLATKALDQLAISRQVRMEHLDGHLVVEPPIPGAIHAG